jgi:hypothetical protein
VPVLAANECPVGAGHSGAHTGVATLRKWIVAGNRYGPVFPR